MPCLKCGGLVVAQKEVSNTSTQRKVLSKCVKCDQYYLIKETKTIITEMPSAYCEGCKKVVPYKIFKDLCNWGAYERSEEEPKEYTRKTCYYCAGLIK